MERVTPAFAQGTVVMEGKEQAFEATFVYAGDVEGFLAGKKGQSTLNFWGGILSLIFGASLAFIVYRSVRK